MNIHSQHLILKKYDSNDLENFCKIICNDEVMLHISGKGNTRLVAQEKFEIILKTNQENKYYGIYKVILKATNEMIGFAKLTPYKKDFEIGYALLPPFWRKGFTNEMVIALTQHGIKYFPSEKLMAIVNIENIASSKVLEKNGYQIYKEENFKGAACYFYEYIKW